MIYEIQAERCVVPGRYDTILEVNVINFISLYVIWKQFTIFINKLF